jgi:signal transduction histidine kinase/DNA-binding response OmpR family regulator
MKQPLKYHIIIFFLLIGFRLSSQAVYQIDTDYPVHELDPHLLYVPEKNQSFSPLEILQDTTITFSSGNSLSRLLFESKVYWGKLKVRTADSLKGWTLQFKDAFIGGPAWAKGNGQVDVYAYTGSELLFHKKSGVEYPKNERDINQNWVLNRISLDDMALDTEVTLVIRVKGNSLGYPPFFRLNLRGPTQAYYHQVYQFNNTFNIFMFGVSFIIFLYHLLQFVYLRERIFLVFSLWLMFCALTMWMSIGGLLGLFTTFRFQVWMIIANMLYFVFWFFGRSFVGSKKKFPVLDKFILVLAFLILAEMVLVLFIATILKKEPFFLDYGFHYLVLFTFSIYGIILSFVLILKKDNFARYFGIGAIIGYFFFSIGSLWSAGLISYPGFDPYAWGMFSQIVIFSFGIAYRRQVISKKANEEKLQAEKNISEMQRGRDLDEIKSKFFANISHEFRTPLSLILGPLQGAERAQNGHSSKYILNETSYNILSRNANRLHNLVDQLLDLSKLESGHVHLSLTNGKMIEFLKAIFFSFESMAERNGINFNINFPHEIDHAYFDKDKLEKIVSNLVSNAIKYTPSNGTVSVSVEDNEGSLYIEIADNGKGIKKEDIKKIFERFYRVEGSEEKGSGIGLALTKELVELHNGQINVYSTIGEGTTFKIHIPHTLEKLPEHRHILDAHDISYKSENKVSNITSALAAIEDAQNTNPTSDKQLVLIVEDNPDLRTYINTVVSKRYRTLLARDGDQGERLAFEHIPDVIISDVMMPKKDGYALCNSLKNNQKTSHIPIIMLTAKAGFDHRMEGFTQGADAYLTKPFKDGELMLRLQNMIESRQKMWKQFQSLDLSLLKDMNLESVDDQFVQEVMHSIKENLDNELFGVEDIARSVGFSRSQLHRKLKAVLNKSCNQLIVEIRMNEAKHMLELRTGNVSEVAYSVGYSNLPYFTKSFKKQFGVLPSKVEKARP